MVNLISKNMSFASQMLAASLTWESNRKKDTETHVSLVQRRKVYPTVLLYQ